MFLRESRARGKKALADLLIYGALVRDGIVLNKDGSLLAGWTYHGPDLTAATSEELAALASRVNRAFLSLGDGWMIHADALRLPAEAYPPPGCFPDPVTALIDDERREQFLEVGRNFTTRYTLLLTYLAPAESKRRLSDWLFAGSSSERGRSADLLLSFEHRLHEIEDVLGPVLNLARLDSSALLTHLHTAITGLAHPVAVPAVPCYLDTVLASADLIGGFEPRIGESQIAAIAISGFPAHTSSGILEPLQGLPFAYRWSNRFIALDPATAADHIRRFRAHWFRSRRGIADLIRLAFTPVGPGGEEPKDGFANRHALDMATDADFALAEANAAEVRYGYYTSTVILTHFDPATLEESCRQVLRLLRNAGFPAQRESTNTVEAYHASLPGHGRTNIRRPLVHTLNLAHLLPTTAVYAGSAINPSPFFAPRSPALLWAATAGSTPFRLSLHVSDVGHTLIVGPTGSGKSSLVGLLQAQWLRYPGAQIFAFDKGASSLPLTLAAGGHHYDVGAETSAGFYPLQHIDQPAERAWAADWIEALLETQGVTVSSEQRCLIQHALDLLASYPDRTLTTFCSKLQDLALRAALAPYTYSGLYGSLFDCAVDPLKTNHYSCFETSSLLEFYPRAVNPLLLYLFHRIEARLDGRPTLIVLEEAWTFLNTPLFADRIQAWLRELRKKNAAVVFVTQSLAELHNSPLRDVIYSSTPTKILLPNAEALNDAGAHSYRALGLNQQETRLLATTAVPKRHYYVTSPLGRRLIDLTLGPVALSFIGSTSREDLRNVQELARLHGRSWPLHWLRSRQLSDQAELLARLAEEPTHV